MSDTVKQLLAEAAEEYRRHQSPEVQAEVKAQSALARAHGNEAGTSWGSRNQGGAAR
ncbi:hypothetical protein [Streptomyces sp. NBC_01304]|uniref:hypothetical protein n=1 Tax=Streptomyces sp. NBC_01304 TaxID=2903818 RepID=UPI002E0D5FA1|nr:hypothetical protein OG430_49160 [Streptomyces sp. NBC_01304]